MASAPWEALSAVYIAEELGGDPIIHSLLKVTTAGGAFLLGYILAKVKVNRYGLLYLIKSTKLAESKYSGSVINIARAAPIATIVTPQTVTPTSLTICSDDCITAFAF